MFLFKKIKIKNLPQNKTITDQDADTGWYLILRTAEDVLKYIEIDSKYLFDSMLDLPNTVNNIRYNDVRSRLVFQALSTQLSLGKEVDPLATFSNLVKGKALSMLKIISDGYQVQINRNKGYIDHERFLKIWDCEILEEIEQEKFDKIFGCEYPENPKKFIK